MQFVDSLLFAAQLFPAVFCKATGAKIFENPPLLPGRLEDFALFFAPRFHLGQLVGENLATRGAGVFAGDGEVQFPAAGARRQHVLKFAARFSGFGLQARKIVANVICEGGQGEQTEAFETFEAGAEPEQRLESKTEGHGSQEGRA